MILPKLDQKQLLLKVQVFNKSLKSIQSLNHVFPQTYLITKTSNQTHQLHLNLNRYTIFSRTQYKHFWVSVQTESDTLYFLFVILSRLSYNQHLCIKLCFICYSHYDN